MSQQSSQAPLIHIIIAAAGTGSRFGAEMPKQFVGLCGRPLLMTTIERLREALPEARMTLVLDEDYIGAWQRLCNDYCFESPDVVGGGATRTASVGHAVAQVGDDVDYILIHDGARPVVAPSLVAGVVTALERHTGAIPAVAVTDSLRLSRDQGLSSQPVDRSLYWAVQTPQGFHAAALKEAYATGSQATDDASLLNLAGYDDIVLTAGDPRNIKVTYPQDLAVAQLYLEQEA